MTLPMACQSACLQQNRGMIKFFDGGFHTPTCNILWFRSAKRMKLKSKDFKFVSVGKEKQLKATIASSAATLADLRHYVVASMVLVMV